MYVNTLYAATWLKGRGASTPPSIPGACATVQYRRQRPQEESVETQTRQKHAELAEPGPRRKEAPRRKGCTRRVLSPHGASGAQGSRWRPGIASSVSSFTPPSASPLLHPSGRHRGRAGGPRVERELPPRVGARPSLLRKSKCPGVNLLGAKLALPLPSWGLGQETELRFHFLLWHLQVKTAPYPVGY